MNLSEVADIFAIPFFGLGVYYFYTKQNRTTTENLLLLFLTTGLVADTFFSIRVLTHS
jgi:hypothetical protein